MSPQLWNNISYILLVTGILFFTVTVILAVKFQLITMLKAEMNRRHGKNKMSAGEEYFNYVESRTHNTNAIEEISTTEDIKEVGADPKPMVSSLQNAPSSADDSPFATVIVSQHSPSAPAEGGTVITAGKMQDDGFRVTDSIMIIHGDPFAIRI